MNGIEAVEKNLVDKYPLGVPFSKAAAMLLYKSAGAAYTARSRGTFPLPVERLGAGLAVRTSVLIDYLRTGERQMVRDTPAMKRPKYKGAGRPTKGEAIEAKNRGISVRELRAQLSIAGV